MKAATLAVETSVWSVTMTDNGPDNMYTVDVDHEKGFKPWNMTSDGTVVHLYYIEDELAEEGTVTWDIGIRNIGLTPEHEVIVAIVKYMKDGTRVLEHHDRPKVRDGSSVM